MTETAWLAGAGVNAGHCTGCGGLSFFYSELHRAGAPLPQVRTCALQHTVLRAVNILYAEGKESVRWRMRLLSSGRN